MNRTAPRSATQHGLDAVPYVLYYRLRPSNERASIRALEQQRALHNRLLHGGDRVISVHYELENALPDYGWTEPRLALRQAYVAAENAASQYGACRLVILRMDAIGEGDPFSTSGTTADLLEDGPSNIWLAQWGWTAMEDQLACEWAQSTGNAKPRLSPLRQPVPDSIDMPSDAPADLSLFVDLGYSATQAPVYLCNGMDKAISGRFEPILSPRTGRKTQGYIGLGSQRNFAVLPGQCQRLFSFERGGWSGEIDRFCFHCAVEDSQFSLAAMVAGGRFVQRWRRLGHPSAGSAYYELAAI